MPEENDYYLTTLTEEELKYIRYMSDSRLRVLDDLRKRGLPVPHEEIVLKDLRSKCSRLLNQDKR